MYLHVCTVHSDQSIDENLQTGCAERSETVRDERVDFFNRSPPSPTRDFYLSLSAGYHSSRSIDNTDAAIFIDRNVSNVKQLVHHNFPRARGIGPQSRYSPYHAEKVTVRKLNDKDHNSFGSMEDKTSSVSSRMIGGSRPCPADDTIGVRR